MATAINVQYPPPAVTISGSNTVTASMFIKSPTQVARALQEFAQLRFVGAKLLKGREPSASGAWLYELVDKIFADSASEPIAPGSAYTRGSVSLGGAAMAKSQKKGKDYEVLDESIAASNYGPIRTAMIKAVNSAELDVDQTCVAAIVSAVTNVITASAAWVEPASGTPTILRDTLLAKTRITGANLGYNPDTLLVDDITWAWMASDSVIANAMARETQQSTVNTGQFPILSGLSVVNIPAANMPGAVGGAWVLDSDQLGFIGQQDLGDGYESAGDLIESKVLRDDDIDGYRLRVRTNFVPVVNNPLAGCQISGVLAGAGL